MSVIENNAPLQTEYLPPEFVDREDEAASIRSALSDISEMGSRNVHLHGPRGTGKTHLIHSRLEELPSQVNTCYVHCSRHDTEYKALKKIYREVVQEEIGSGYHASDLQRKIEERTGSVQTVVVLDEADFLLLNDGDSLLYFLSRMENSENLSIVTVSSNHSELPLEERTQSSLQPVRVEFPLYTGEEVYEILRRRAEDALSARSVHRHALTFIASSVSNIKKGLHWLKAAAEESGDVITEEAVKDVENQAYRNYVEELLDPFSTHHDLLYQAIEELTREKGRVQTGEIYERYEKVCGSYEEDSRSERRVSDFLKHLELLNLIEADYHYGGRKGKTREVSLFK